MHAGKNIELFGHRDDAYVWRKGGPCNVNYSVSTVKHNGGRIILWGCLSGKWES